MKLLPFEPDTPTLSIGINEALADAGILLPEDKAKNLSPAEIMKNELNKNSAGLDTCARVLSEMLEDKDQRKAAVDCILKIHGLLKDAERPAIPAVNIVFGSQDNREVNALLVPR